MGDAMHTRGPDHGAVWVDPKLPLGLSHRRLAILDLTKDGHQPMISPSGRYVMVYNGEFYNFQEIKSELEALGQNFKGRSDTEVFLGAVDQWGLNRALPKMVGMFAFALWDMQERELHFVRDRMGQKPLYVGWADDGALLFGSEIKALRSYAGFTPKLNQDTLGAYFKYGCVPAPLCIYEGVSHLPGGFRLSIKPGEITPGTDLTPLMKPYFHHIRVAEEAREKPFTGSLDEATNELEDILGQAVGRRMISDVPLGSFLSGGIDSSLITALMQKQASSNVKTYTIGFHEADFNEAEYAKEIAKHLGTDHHEHYLSSSEALDIIPGLPQMYDEPFADISAIPTYLLSKFTRGDVTVALSGDGGDEMFGGYRRHFQGPQIWNSIQYIPHALRQLMATGGSSLPDGLWRAIFTSKPHIHASVDRALNLFSAQSDKDLYDKLIQVFDAPDSILAGILAGTAQPQKTHLTGPDWDVAKDLKLAEKMMLWDTLNYLPNDILTKVDRASMAVSLEARAPLLDHSVFQFAQSLPLHYKTHDGEGKIILKNLLARHVPTALFNRPKSGFSIPVHDWLKGPLKEWASDLLAPEKIATDGILNEAEITRIWHRHLNSQGNHAIQLWSILMFQSWKEHYQ